MFKRPKTIKTLNEQKTKPYLDNQSLTMEEYASSPMSLIAHGCKLVKELESSLDTKPDQVENVTNLCDRIAKTFGSAAERLRGQAGGGDHHRSMPAPQQFGDNNYNNNIDSSLHEWLVHGLTQGIDHAIQPAGGSSAGQLAVDLLVSATTNACSSSSSQRPRRRRNGSETRIVKMAASQIGNTELPPDDGYTWRKYGQKEIMGKKYPRGYYRCTHQRQFNCSAKKQVQRDELDPSMFEVTYRGSHTCHLSATAPSTLPSQPVILSHHHVDTSTHMVTASSSTSPLGNWLSMDFGDGPSRPGPEFPVADLADAMFNSGSSSTSNSMDFLFPSIMEEHKRDVNGTKKVSY